MTTIRKATKEDIGLINSLAQIIFPQTYCEIISQQQIEFMFDMMYSISNIEKQMNQGHQYFIAEGEGEPCGYLSFRELSPEHFYIEKIYTLPSLHGSGVGRTLFEFAISLSKERCPEKSCLLELNVNRYNKRAISFYTKMGMRPDRQTDNEVGGGFYANDYVMAIDL